MKIKDELEQISLPKIYKRNGKQCYFDTYRKRLIEITPEEIVRQKIACYFEKVLGVPYEFMLIEVQLAKYGIEIKGRADIVIHEPIDDELMKPIAVIECKNSDVFLTDKVTEQAIGYSDNIGANYIIITNGIDIEIARFNEELDVYEKLDKLLTYDEMLKQIGTVVKYKEKGKGLIERFTLDNLSDPILLNEFNDTNIHWVFGQNTPQVLRSVIVNIYQCLMDMSHKLLPIIRDNFELIEDIGIRYMDYGNAGGGHYLGNYRAFLIKDNNGDTQIISMSVFGTDPDFRMEHRKSYTSLVVAVDKFKVSHNSLQYNIDRFTSLQPDSKIKFSHNGQMSSRLSSDVKEYVLLKSSNIKEINGKLELGKISCNRLLYIDSSEVSEFIYNIIEYGILREEFRNYMGS